MDCKRLPGNYIEIKGWHLNIKKDRYDNPLWNNLPRYLDEFIKRNDIKNDGLIELCYTDNDVIVIISKNKVAWTETLHNKLCDTFDVILHYVERVELFEPRNYKCDVYYFYIPKFHDDKYNDEFSVKFKDIKFS